MASATLIVGLGNPGPEYALSRHNVGFWVLDQVSQAHRIPIRQSEHFAVTGSGSIRGWRVILAKPQTYMNRSGKAVSALLRAEGLGPEDLIVLHDDMDIELGRVKLKTSGGDAGHKGVGSVIHSLGTGDFRRLRIGLGRPPRDADGEDWVLSPFQPEEAEAVEGAVAEAAERIVALVSQGRA